MYIGNGSCNVDCLDVYGNPTVNHPNYHYDKLHSYPVLSLSDSLMFATYLDVQRSLMNSNGSSFSSLSKDGFSAMKNPRYNGNSTYHLHADSLLTQSSQWPVLSIDKTPEPHQFMLPFSKPNTMSMSLATDSCLPYTEDSHVENSLYQPTFYKQPINFVESAHPPVDKMSSSAEPSVKAPYSFRSQLQPLLCEANDSYLQKINQFFPVDYLYTSMSNSTSYGLDSPMLPVDFVQRNQGLWSPSPLTNGSKSFQDCGAIVTSSQVKSLPDPIKDHESTSMAPSYNLSEVYTSCSSILSANSSCCPDSKTIAHDKVKKRRLGKMETSANDEEVVFEKYTYNRTCRNETNSGETNLLPASSFPCQPIEQSTSSKCHLKNHSTDFSNGFKNVDQHKIIERTSCMSEPHLTREMLNVSNTYLKPSFLPCINVFSRCGGVSGSRPAVEEEDSSLVSNGSFDGLSKGTQSQNHLDSNKFNSTRTSTYTKSCCVPSNYSAVVQSSAPLEELDCPIVSSNASSHFQSINEITHENDLKSTSSLISTETKTLNQVTPLETTKEYTQVKENVSHTLTEYTDSEKNLPTNDKAFVEKKGMHDQVSDQELAVLCKTLTPLSSNSPIEGHVAVSLALGLVKIYDSIFNEEHQLKQRQLDILVNRFIPAVCSELSSPFHLSGSLFQTMLGSALQVYAKSWNELSTSQSDLIKTVESRSLQCTETTTMLVRCTAIFCSALDHFILDWLSQLQFLGDSVPIPVSKKQVYEKLVLKFFEPDILARRNHRVQAISGLFCTLPDIILRKANPVS